MSRFARNLARITSGPSRGEEGSREQHLGGRDTGPHGGPAGSNPPQQTAEHTDGDQLVRLRRALERLQARQEQAEKTLDALEVETGERGETLQRLFERVGTSRGDRLRRRRFFRSGTLVGQVRLQPPGTLRMELLALLAGVAELAEPGADDGVLYLDTETTGLARGTGTIAFLVGLGWWEDDMFVVEQSFVPAPGAESPVLEWVKERLEKSRVLVTFNGKSFDMPLLASRLVMNRMGTAAVRPHVDLLHVARRLHRYRLRSMRLGEVERHVLGMDRTSDIPSDQVAARYLHFLRTGDGRGLGEVLDHNEWDVLAMAAMVSVYAQPWETIHPVDLAAAAETFRRNKKLDAARRAAELAVQRGAGAAGWQARAHVSKALGDRNAALLDFERVVEARDDPSARLELAKLYEHTLRDFEAALRLVEQGTSETEDQQVRRKRRLLRKLRSA